MSASSDYLSTLTRLSEAKAQVEAEAARQSGQIWGGALSNIGQYISQIPEQRARLAEIKNRADLTALETQREQRAAATEQRQVTAQQQASQFLQQLPKTPEGLWDVNGAMQGLAASGLDPQHVESFTTGLQKLNDMTLGERKRQEEANADRAHGLLSIYKGDEPITPESMSFNAEALKAIGGLSDADAQAIHDISANAPAGTDLRPYLKAIEQKKKEYQPSYKTAAPGSTIYEEHTGATQATVPNPAADARQTELDRHNKAMEDIAKLRVGKEEGSAIETARHNKAMEALGQQRASNAAAANAPVESIQPGTPDYQMAQDLASGKLTMVDFQRLYGRAATNANKKASLYYTARQLNPDFNPADFELGFKIAGNPQIVQRVVAINALKPVVTRMEQLIDQSGNGDIPAVNGLLNAAKFQLGNQTVTNFRQLQTVLGDEIGNALGVGTGSDLKTKMGIDLVDPNLSPKNFRSNMDQAMKALEQRRTELQRPMGPYGSRLNPAPETPPAGATQDFPVTAPDGNTYHFDSAAKAAQFKARAGIK